MLLFISLGVNVGIKEINDGRDFIRIFNGRGLNRHDFLIKPIKGNIEINEHRPDEHQSDNGQ